MYYTKEELNRARNAIIRAARDNGVPEAEVRAEMIQAMNCGRNNPDPTVQEKWSSFQYTGAEPTAEEFIAWCIRLATNQNQ